MIIILIFTQLDAITGSNSYILLNILINFVNG